ncbi:MAG: hypothetical protein WCK65_14595 [Rhodospirillaceae bacterium]
MFWNLLEVGQLFDIGAKAVVILGGLFTAWQYHETVVAARIERSFEYVETLFRGNEAAARSDIATELRVRLNRLPTLRVNKLSPASAQQLHASLVRMLVNDS